eukprot:TRINITY_DN23184_c0_g1_i3.p1 TRINITY_DN23184_c0_g1~~TRINITY_DN23184_c0_g1_i3.p1  ORF type:complete len:299 (-),score=43.48 TRINITY_DN23184_c0_g1_i3:184-1080(-)
MTASPAVAGGLRPVSVTSAMPPTKESALLLLEEQLDRSRQWSTDASTPPRPSSLNGGGSEEECGQCEAPQAAMDDDADEREEVSQGDGFRCHLCEKIIEDGEAVYMCRDWSYCSAQCRRRGRRIAAMQLEFRRTCSGSVISTIDSAVSESSCTSSAPSRAPPIVPATKGGVIGWILGKVVGKLAKMVEGTDILREVSSYALQAATVSAADAAGERALAFPSQQLQLSASRLGEISQFGVICDSTGSAIDGCLLRGDGGYDGFATEAFGRSASSASQDSDHHRAAAHSDFARLIEGTVL